MAIVTSCGVPRINAARIVGEGVAMETTINESSAKHAIRGYSLTGNLWWLLPPAAALFYPQAVKALYESGQLLHRASGPSNAVAWLAIVGSVGLVYSVPAVSIG